MPTIAFTRIDLPYGWLGNMSRHRVKHLDTWWETTEALFQALRLKLTYHPNLKRELLETGDAEIIEDCSNRDASVWGAQKVDGQWVGENLLGKL